MSEGAVWLHRKLLDSDIWTSGPMTIQVAIGCLLMANWEDQQWYNRSLHKTQLIPRGSFVGTQDTLAKRFNLTRQNIRTSLQNLSNMQFLTTTPTGRVTTITLLKYDMYQKLPTRKVTTSLTSHQPATNQPSTRLEEVKKLRSKEERRGDPPFSSLSLSEYVNTWREKPEWERKENAAAVAEGLKKYKLAFRTEEDLYQQIMGETTNGTIRSKSIFEQAAERKRTQGSDGLRREAAHGPVFARFRDLPKVSPETGDIDGE